MGGMTVIGKGELNWDRCERIEDRYGAVHLSGVRDFDAGGAVGRRGRLVARVLESRRSAHIGDLFHGFYPPKDPPPVGEEIVLGQGTLFVDESGIGLRPDDGREVFWLDPRALYRAHSNVVELRFEEEESP